MGFYGDPSSRGSCVFMRGAVRGLKIDNVTFDRLPQVRCRLETYRLNLSSDVRCRTYRVADELPERRVRAKDPTAASSATCWMSKRESVLLRHGSVRRWRNTMCDAQTSADPALGPAPEFR